MDEEIEQLAYCGVLRRIDVEGAATTFRIYPFVWDRLGEPSVLSIRFVEPDFSADSLASLLGDEIDIAIYSTEVVLLQGASRFTDVEGTVLSGRKISWGWADYDLDDLRRAVEARDRRIAELSSELRAAERKNDKGYGLTLELVRRAEIKAAASPELAERQAAALSVLERLRTHFEPD